VQAGEWVFRLPATEGGVSGGINCTYYGSTVDAGLTNPSRVPRDSGDHTYALFWRWDGTAGFAEVSGTLTDGKFVKSRTEIDSGGNLTQFFSYTDALNVVHTDEQQGAAHSFGSAPQYCHQTLITVHGNAITLSGPDAELTFFRPGGGSIDFSGDETYSYGGGIIPDLASPGGGVIGGSESGYTEVLLHEDPTDEINYAFGFSWEHFGDPDGPVDVVLDLYYVHAPTATVRLMRETTGLTVAHGEVITLRAEHDADNLITCTLTTLSGGTVTITFDLDTDVADQDGLAVPVLTTGDPGSRSPTTPATAPISAARGSRSTARVAMCPARDRRAGRTRIPIPRRPARAERALAQPVRAVDAGHRAGDSGRVARSPLEDRGLPITANRVWVGTGYAWAAHRDQPDSRGVEISVRLRAPGHAPGADGPDRRHVAPEYRRRDLPNADDRERNGMTRAATPAPMPRKSSTSASPGAGSSTSPRISIRGRRSAGR
jgi:hypothetical protein